MAPYQGATVTPKYRRLWRNGASRVNSHLPVVSRVYAGEAARQLQVWVRRGNFQRSYHPHGVDGDYGQPGGRKGTPFWYADWVVNHIGNEVPNQWELLTSIQTCDISQDFQSNGVASCTITIDNISYLEQNGIHGLYHLIMLGALSPLRGFTPKGQPPSQVQANEWFIENRQALPNAQIIVLMGYGTELVPIFAGLIDDVDPNAKPATITLSARDFGGVLVDQHVFGWAKDRRVHRIIFAPKAELEHLRKVGGGASASTTRRGYSPNSVSIVGTETHWESGKNNATDDVEWIEIRLPEGHYRSIYVSPAFANQDLYVGFYVKPLHIGGSHYHAHWTPDEGAEMVIDEEHLFVGGHQHGIPYGFFTLGKGLVRNGHPRGEWPWIARRFNTSPKGIRIDLGGSLHTGADTVLRIGVRKLARRNEEGSHTFRAGITRLLAYKTEPTPKGEDHSQLIPIDDVAEIVKILLRWAGFKEWEVEDTGVQLAQRYVLDISKSFMDVINELKEQLGYVFFIAEPTSMESLGVPIFRNTRVLENTQRQIDLITENDLLEDVQAKWSNKEERWPIRARGNLLARSKGGQTLGPDQSFRAQFTYVPPWQPRMAGVIKHLTHYDPKYETTTDCRFACYLIAVQVALSVLTATIEIPGTPHIGLDSYVRIRDGRTGLEGVRVYVTNRHIGFKQGAGSGGSGNSGEFTTQLGGAIADTPDIEQITKDYNHALADLDRNDRP